mmetsp:Transcript_3189/g.7369  ORF Transcript_3189/g.7369 Transcript_3189/m.7369 type:complete len:209 (+) Transcript_3189:1575-2201(+)
MHTPYPRDRDRGRGRGRAHGCRGRTASHFHLFPDTHSRCDPRCGCRPRDLLLCYLRLPLQVLQVAPPPHAQALVHHQVGGQFEVGRDVAPLLVAQLVGQDLVEDAVPRVGLVKVLLPQDEFLEGEAAPTHDAEGHHPVRLGVAVAVQRHQEEREVVRVYVQVDAYVLDQPRDVEVQRQFDGERTAQLVGAPAQARPAGAWVVGQQAIH